jgi:hypothetical protein
MVVIILDGNGVDEVMERVVRVVVRGEETTGVMERVLLVSGGGGGGDSIIRCWMFDELVDKSCGKSDKCIFEHE